MRSKKLVIHIGLPKTATTSLQVGLFSRHSEINYIGRNFADKEFEKSLYKLIEYDSILNSEIDLKYIQNTVYDYIDSSSKKVSLISFEPLTQTQHDIGVIAQRLNECFPEAYILITIRKQIELLRSYFAGGHANRKYNFDKWILEEEGKDKIFSILNFYELVDFYERLFTKPHILVLTYEDFVKDKLKFCEEFSSKLDIDETETMAILNDNIHLNKSTHGVVLWEIYKDCRKKIFPNTHFSKISPSMSIKFRNIFLNKIKIKNKVQIGDDSVKHISEKYRSSNEKLKINYGIDYQ